MTEEDLKSADRVFRLLFQSAAGDVARLVEVVENINNDAIDMRTVLRAAEEGAAHPKTKAGIADIGKNYERTLKSLGDCGVAIGNLITSFKDADYQARFERARPKNPGEVSRDTLNKMILAGLDLNASMTTRHSDWSAVLINFANLVRGVDGAQAVLLARPPKIKKAMALAKAAASEGIGSLLSGFGFLVAVAEAHDTHVDKLIDNIAQATGIVDRLNAFDELLLHQIDVADFTLDRIAGTAASEREFLQKFNSAFGSPESS